MADKKLPVVRMTSFRPYLLRATYDWLCENNQTPHILVDLSIAGIELPEFLTRGNDRITLNISTSATAFLQMTMDGIGFNCRFSGRDHKVYIPNGAIMAIFAKETGVGHPMPNEVPSDNAILPAVVPSPLDRQTSSATRTTSTLPKSRSHLSVVPKGGDA